MADQHAAGRMGSPGGCHRTRPLSNTHGVYRTQPALTRRRILRHPATGAGQRRMAHASPSSPARCTPPLRAARRLAPGVSARILAGCKPSMQVLFRDLKLQQAPFEWVYDGLQPLRIRDVVERRQGVGFTLGVVAVAGRGRVAV